MQKIGLTKGIAGKTMVVQGLGNVGSNTALISQKEGGVKIIGISEREGSIFDANGIDVEQLLAFRKEHGTIIGYPGSTHVGGPLAALELECDILVPAALENQITTGKCRPHQSQNYCRSRQRPCNRRCRYCPSQKGRTDSA
jgi:glutamate dehydrogenase (NAD(P)+)